MPLGARLWHYAAELHTLSVTYPLCGLALTKTGDNFSEMCPLKLTDFCLFLSHHPQPFFSFLVFPSALTLGTEGDLPGIVTWRAFTTPGTGAPITGPP